MTALIDEETGISIRFVQSFDMDAFMRDSLEVDVQTLAMLRAFEDHRVKRMMHWRHIFRGGGE